MCTLKVPNAGSHAILWTQENISHTDTVIGMDSAALAASVPYPGVATRKTFFLNCVTHSLSLVSVSFEAQSMRMYVIIHM